MFTEQRAPNQCRTLLPSPIWWPIPGGNCTPCSWCKSLVGKLTFQNHASVLTPTSWILEQAWIASTNSYIQLTSFPGYL